MRKLFFTLIIKVVWVLLCNTSFAEEIQNSPSLIDREIFISVEHNSVTLTEDILKDNKGKFIEEIEYRYYFPELIVTTSSERIKNNKVQKIKITKVNGVYHLVSSVFFDKPINLLYYTNSKLKEEESVFIYHGKYPNDEADLYIPFFLDKKGQFIELGYFSINTHQRDKTAPKIEVYKKNRLLYIKCDRAISRLFLFDQTIQPVKVELE